MQVRVFRNRHLRKSRVSDLLAPHKPLASLGKKKKEGVDFLTPMTSSIPLLNNTDLIELHCYMEILVKEKIYASCLKEFF